MDPSFASLAAWWEVEDDDDVDGTDGIAGIDGGWWTVARTFGRRLVDPPGGMAVPAPPPGD